MLFINITEQINYNIVIEMKIDLKLISMISLSYLAFIVYTLPMTFFPLMAKKKGVSETFIGLSFANFALGTTISSVIFGKLMGKLGKHKLLYICMMLCMNGSIGFGMIESVENVYCYILIACVSRFVSGFM
jgi:MFS family permease